MWFENCGRLHSGIYHQRVMIFHLKGIWTLVYLYEVLNTVRVVLVIKATMMSVATASFFPYLALSIRWNQHSFCDHAGTYLEILKVFRHRWPEVCRKPVLAGNTKGVESSVQ